MKKWAVYADWDNNGRREQAWWVINSEYPDGALMQGGRPAMFKTEELAKREAVKVALIVSDWLGGYDVSVMEVSWMPPLNQPSYDTLIGEA